jgi:tripartite-type tricarboxylate transporter receptor subunit TctC
MCALSRRCALALGSSVVLLPSAARAQGAWPSGSITFIVGYAPGGGPGAAGIQITWL